MPDKCKKGKGSTIVPCDAAAYAISTEVIRLQDLRNMETGKRRQQLAIVKGREWAPFNYCPWCRANINTAPKEAP